MHANRGLGAALPTALFLSPGDNHSHSDMPANRKKYTVNSQDQQVIQRHGTVMIDQPASSSRGGRSTVQLRDIRPLVSTQDQYGSPLGERAASSVSSSYVSITLPSLPSPRLQLKRVCSMKRVFVSSVTSSPCIAKAQNWGFSMHLVCA